MTEKREDKLRQLKGRLAQISDVSSANGLLMWDKQTYMPKGGVAGRAEQTATLSRIAHEMLVDAETERLLNALDLPDPTSEDDALVRRARREYEKATRLPGELVAEISRATVLAEHAWAEARARSGWSLFAPHLEKILPLQREAAEHLGYEDHPYDALLDGYEPGAKKARLERMFEELKAGLVPLIRSISERDGEDREAPLHGAFDEAAQERFGEEVITRFGYDWERGRQDRTVHPFCIGLTSGDVRITTRFDPRWLSPALFGTMHETGHALYEQGVNPAYARTPLGGGTSMGVHESQSRLWENLVGRSRPFWYHFYPGLQEVFPEALGGVEAEEFYRAINVVSPSEIRVEADEVTYNLHILLRFELEVALIEGSLPVSDLPSAWNAKMEEYLGVTPENDAEGALQDVHWSAGLFGYFPTYTIGNVLSVQLFDEAVSTYPAIPEQIAEGEFSSLLDWLRENIHRHGSRYYPDELIQHVTGRPLDTAPYLEYLKRKFGELYEL
ncbi:carboxypeptidase M32 [soil metagenome]